MRRVVTRDPRLMADAASAVQNPAYRPASFIDRYTDRIQTGLRSDRKQITMSFSDISRFVRYDMWRRTTTEFDGFFQRLGYGIIRTIVLVVRGFTSKNLNAKAKALTYSLIFAIIPILAMTIAIAKGFGVADVIEQQLNKSFLSETNVDVVPTIMEMVQRYLDTTQGGLFIGIGLLILLWAVYSFFQSVEDAFNRIWNVRNSRSILRQAATYIAIVVLIPVLIVCSAGINIWVHTTMESTIHYEFINDFLRTSGAKFLQFFLCWIFFTLMYIAIPNTRVRFVSALIPGVLMGTLFQLLQMLSVYLIAFLSRTSIVYGAFATIPILMIWLQYTSLLILIGAEMSYAIQNNEEFEYEQDLNSMSRRYKDFIMLYLLSVIIKRFEHDEDPLTAHELAVHDRLPIRLVNQLLGRLVETGILREVYVEGKEERTVQPAMDTHMISVGMVIHRIDQQGTELFLQATSPEMQRFWERYLLVRKEHNTLDNIFINELC